MQDNGGQWKTAFFILLFIIVAAGIGVGAFFMGKNMPTSDENANPTPVQTLDTLPTVTPSPTPTVNDEEEIISAIALHLEQDEEDLDIIVTDLREGFAKGNVKEKDALAGGGYFIAAKVDGEWIIVYDGQANPTCDEISPYSFPSDMVPECLDNLGNVISRE